MRSAIKYQDKHQNEVIFVTSVAHFSKYFLQKKRLSESSKFRSNHNVSPYNQHFTFTGKEKDAETGFSYFGARYYDPALSSLFISVDPMADKYPNISPYAYCMWNPVKLVDPDGNETIENDDWYKNSKGEMKWFNSSSEIYIHEGEKYKRVGKNAIMTNSDGNVVYGDCRGHIHNSVPLQTITVSETLTDFERTMLNPIVKSIHQSAFEFWGHPVTNTVVDATLFVVTGGLEALIENIGKTVSRRSAKVFFRKANYSKKVQMQIMQNDLHSFPQAVDGYATKYGKFSKITGGDGKSYKSLTMKGGYKGKDGKFEYLKDNNGIINHRFFKTN